MGKCLLCNKELVKGQTKFCCSEHSNQYKINESIKNWLDGNDEGWSGTGIKKFIRNYLIKEANYKCELCGWGEINPYSGNLPLEIHHKDGNYKHNTLDNLQVLCPNCHSLTDNYKSMNKDSCRERGEYANRKIENENNICIDCGAKISIGATRCRTCSNKQRTIPLENMLVSREELKELIRNQPFTTIGKQFGVSDNSVKKWCDKYNLPRTKKEINKYSDEEWSNI